MHLTILIIVKDYTVKGLTTEIISVINRCENMPLSLFLKSKVCALSDVKYIYTRDMNAIINR